MTSNLKDLVDSTFYMMYHLSISPSEIDNLSTYEMREYINLLNEKRKVENESESSMFRSLTSVLGFKRKGKI